MGSVICNIPDGTISIERDFLMKYCKDCFYAQIKPDVKDHIYLRCSDSEKCSTNDGKNFYHWQDAQSDSIWP